MPLQRIVHTGTLSFEQTQTYVYLPFDVPLGCHQVQIAYNYSNRIGSSPQLSGGNTIDLGVFDARGSAYLEGGLRGWSGSERAEVIIGEYTATPGYLAGPLEPGCWHVALGLYKIAPEGCEYRVEVTLASEADPSPAPPPWMQPVAAPPPARPAPPPWLRGELHCHTWHSDGDGSPWERVALARARGLDFLAITDHNTISGQRELMALPDPGLIVIRGLEVTTFKGHFNVWGIDDWVDFRVQQPEDMIAALAFAHARGALTACNHPKPFGPAWEYEVTATNYSCIEVWNGPWHTLNEAALAFWLRQLADGRRIPAIGGSDYHRKRQLVEQPPRIIGTPTVWVYVPGSTDAAAILDAVRHGHVSLSDNPDGPFLDLRAGAMFAAIGGDVVSRPANQELPIRVYCMAGLGGRLQILDQNGVQLEQIITTDNEVIEATCAVAHSRFVRAELRDITGTMQALTNPIYIE